MKLLAALVALGCLGAQVMAAQRSPSRLMASTVIQQWPDGVVSTDEHPRLSDYQEGMLLDGVAAEWHTTADGDDYRYIKATVDRYVTSDGPIKDEVVGQDDVINAEFEHFNTLSDRFGIHFNPVLRNHIVGADRIPGELTVPAGTGVFESPHKTYMKDTCTISVTKPAKPVFTDKGDVMMATARYGKGIVYAVVDPWLYNEYRDGRNISPEYDTVDSAIDLAGWAVRQ